MDRVMHLMRCLSFFIAWWDISLVCEHIPGVEKCAPDALSCGSLSLFQSLVPEAEVQSPTHS